MSDSAVDNDITPKVINKNPRNFILFINVQWTLSIEFEITLLRLSIFWYDIYTYSLYLILCICRHICGELTFSFLLALHHTKNNYSNRI